MQDLKLICVTICGVPNVGKSTLLNHILQEKISIVSSKPQTTRDNIRGILNKGDTQVVFTDTPGIFKIKTKNQIEKNLLLNAWTALNESEFGVILVNEDSVDHNTKAIVERFKQMKIPFVMAINKIDQMKENAKILLAEKVYNLYLPDELFFTSAKSGAGCEKLINYILSKATKTGYWLYEKETGKTDITPEFWIKESVREKLFEIMEKEIPYSVGIEIDLLELYDNEAMKLSASIYSNKESHKKIIIGKHGEKIKTIAALVNKDIKDNLGLNAVLDLKVKFDEKWFLKI